MGPPELPGGNETLDVTEPPQVLPLQWGRRNYPAETKDKSPKDILRDMLQWGRRNYPAETEPTSR